MPSGRRDDFSQHSIVIELYGNFNLKSSEFRGKNATFLTKKDKKVFSGQGFPCPEICGRITQNSSLIRQEAEKPGNLLGDVNLAGGTELEERETARCGQGGHIDLDPGERKFEIAYH